MFKPCGYYVFENHFRKFNSWPIDGIRGCGAIIAYFVSVIWAIYLIITEIENQNIPACLLYVQFLIFELGSVYVSLQAFRCKNDILAIFDTISNLNSFGVPYKLKTVNKVFTRSLKAVHWLSITFSFLCTHFLLFDKNSYNENKTINNHDMIRNTLFINHIPKATNWQKTLLTLLEIYICIVITNICVSLSLLYTYIIELAVIHFEQLGNKISEIHFTIGQKENLQLRQIVEYHQKLLSLFKRISNVANCMAIPTVAALLMLVSISAVSLSISRNFLNLIVFGGALIFLCSIHISGQRLSNAGSDVNDAIYNLNWYDANTNMQKCVHIIICSTQRTLRFELGGFGSLTNESLGNRLKATYIYYQWVNLLLMRKTIVTEGN